jgi:hypothetical protein
MIGEAAPGGNPFPATAVATGSELVTIETPAVREVRQLLDDYLTNPTRAGAGNVIAVTGEYGTGKTHLAAEMVRHIGATAGGTTYTIAIEATVGDFVALYKLFVSQLDHTDVLSRVREYYADIVAETLAQSELTQRLVPGLRTGKLDPVHVVDRLMLIDSDLLQRVGRTLEDVTRKEEFGIALTLLLRSGFDEAVWEWFEGRAPDQILVDRGIRDAIGTDELALEAMGVFALLYGHRGHSFVLLVDELHKLLSDARRPAGAIVTAFKRLLEVFAAAHGLLILVGLEDYIDVVGADVVERIGRTIKISMLSAEDVEDYIIRSKAALGKAALGGPATLAPFTPDTVRYIVKITDGVARRVLRLCHHLYRRAVTQGTSVTEAMVREVARNQVVSVTLDSVRQEVRTVLDAEGLSYFRDYRVGTDARTRVDYWVRLGDGETGCAVLITDGVFGPGEVNDLGDRAVLVRNAAPGSDMILVVVGLLPVEQRDALADLLGIEPLEYNQWTFHTSLSSIIGRRVTDFENSLRADPLTMVSNRIERMSKQHTNTQRYVDQLATSIDAMRTLSEHEFDAVHRLLEEMSRAVLSTSGPVTRSGTGDLPPSVDGLFDDATTSLSVISRIDSVLREALSGGMRTREMIRTRMTLKVLEAIGVASLLRTLLASFRDQVTDWYRGHSGTVQDADRTRLSMLCRSYDELYDHLPVFRLDDLDFFGHSATDLDRFGHSATGGLASQRQLVHARETFDGFGARVQEAMMSAVSGSNQPPSSP